MIFLKISCVILVGRVKIRWSDWSLSYVRGRPLSTEYKKAVVKLKLYLSRNAKELDTCGSPVDMTADALEVGSATVRRVMAEYNKNPNFIHEPPKSRGRPAFSIDSSHQEIVRQYIRKANLNGQSITLEDITRLVRESSNNDEFHLATLARALDRWGFTFGKGIRTQQLREKDHIIAARRRYLREKIGNRSTSRLKRTIRPEVFLDESYVNKNHSNDFVWYSEQDGPLIKKPTGKGERLIIINAITDKGWVKGAKLIYTATRRTGDYHGQVNHDLFKKWFSEKLLPNIESDSLIIMDNASYHNVLSEDSAPTGKSSKEAICSWLHDNKIPVREDALKSEMVEILAKIAPSPTYAIDRIAEQHGHRILRTPPYHPELQPIELAWGVAKNYVARNCDFTLKKLRRNLESGLESVDQSTVQKMIKKVAKTEDKFWKEDLKLDSLE